MERWGHSWAHSCRWIEGEIDAVGRLHHRSAVEELDRIEAVEGIADGLGMGRRWKERRSR